MKILKSTKTYLIIVAILATFNFNTIGQTIQNDVFWHDTDGNPIYSQGGGVLKVDDTYYWYGVKYNGAITYYNNPYSGKNGDIGFHAITCYSSTDLVNWKYEGDAMTADDGLGGWIGRIGCAYNAPTGKYVLIAQMYPGLVFGTSDTPNGHFTKAATQSVIENVVNDMTGDQSVFTDDDGQAYLAYCNVEGRSHQYISRLRPSDYLYVEPAVEIHRGGGREGNVLFKHNGTYYFISSDLHGWNTSHTYCITATNILGPYSSEFVMEGTRNDYSHVTQSGLALTVNGTSGSFAIFGGDRWADFAGNGVGYNQWLPITFDGDKPVFHSLSQWNINAAEGTWSVGSGNNYVLNPNFEADRIDVSNITGWKNWTNLTSGNPNGNTKGSHSPGRFAMSQWHSGPYKASTYQDIKLPNGSYNLTTWVKSSGGQYSAKIFVSNGNGEMNYPVNQPIDNWTEVSIPNIKVTNGSVRVGVFSDANAGNWVNVDDFSLVRTDSLPKFNYASVTENNTKQILIELSNTIIDSIYYTGFTVNVDDVEATIDSTVLAGENKLAIHLSDSVQKDNEITLSYSSGNVVFVNKKALLSFNDTLVDNLLYGSSPRIIEAASNKTGDTLLISFNKKMQLAQASSTLSLIAEYDELIDVEIFSGTFCNNDSSLLTFALSDTVYKDYVLELNYTGDNIVSADNGRLKPVSDFPVLNNSYGLPVTILSAKLGDDNTSCRLNFSKALVTQSIQAGNFTLYRNGKMVKFANFHVVDSSINFILSSSMHYGDTLRISYFPGSVQAYDNGILKEFNEFVIENNINPPGWVEIPAKIEAENFSSQRGVETEETNDEGGGLNVRNIDKGDWLEYAIENNSNETAYQISLRVAAKTSGSVIRFYIDDKFVGNVTVPVTGNLQVYETVTQNIEISEGKHYLKFDVIKGGFNLNYFDIHKVIIGINNIDEKVLTIYPNPASNEITISSENFSHNKIEIFDTKGNLLIKKATFSETVLRVPIDLMNGIYFVKISGSKQYKMKKIVIVNN